jgi:endo-alpha-1,4-polygalactosaminidase (GH114 family)
MLILGLLAANVRLVGAEPSLPPKGGYDTQLGGDYAPPNGVTVVSRDRSSRPAKGLYSICYINAFQTQSEETDWWKANHPDLLLRTSAGALAEDPNWPGEIILDTSTREKREALFAAEAKWVRQCAEAGFAAVELDNLDTWTRTDGALTKEDNLGLALLLSGMAHDLNMAVAQKNSVELGSAGKALGGFDFAIAEECEVYQECDAYIAVYGENVFEIEYSDNDPAIFERACAKRGDRIAIVLRDRDLATPKSRGYVYKTC